MHTTSSTSLWLTTTIRPIFPLGPVVRWPVAGGSPLECTLLDGANRYLIVHLDPALAESEEARLEDLRVQLCVAAGWTPTANEPKLACVARSSDPATPLRFRVRQNPAQGWHPAMAASGILSLAATAGTPGTVVARLLGAPASGRVDVSTPGGDRTFQVSPADDGLMVEYQLSPVTVVTTEGTSTPVRTR